MSFFWGQWLQTGVNQQIAFDDEQLLSSSQLQKIINQLARKRNRKQEQLHRIQISTASTNPSEFDRIQSSTASRNPSEFDSRHRTELNRAELKLVGSGLRDWVCRIEKGSVSDGIWTSESGGSESDGSDGGDERIGEWRIGEWRIGEHIFSLKRHRLVLVVIFLSKFFP